MVKNDPQTTIILWTLGSTTSWRTERRNHVYGVVFTAYLVTLNDT